MSTRTDKRTFDEATWDTVKGIALLLAIVGFLLVTGMIVEHLDPEPPNTVHTGQDEVQQ